MTEERKEWIQEEGTFSLTRNPDAGKPTKSGKEQPSMKGQLKIAGVLYDISAWAYTAKSGNKWLSGTVKPPFASSQGVAAPKMVSDLDENIPF